MSVNAQDGSTDTGADASNLAAKANGQFGLGPGAETLGHVDVFMGHGPYSSCA